MNIEVQSVSKTFGKFTALRDVSLTIGEGKLSSLLGPSGCGKTTLLRILAGLETPDSGSVIFAGEDQTKVHPRLRKVGFVFQHYALFRHMTVFENVAFGLRVKNKEERPSNEQIRREVHEMLSLVQLDNQSHKYPQEMSGGQRQRVALARALVIKPKILLLDEPFGALDANVRKDLRRWLRRLHDEINLTSILVTHDQEEALEVSDQVVIMNEGRIEQAGSPEEIYRQPANPFVYEFLGSVNVFHGRIDNGRLVQFGTQESGGDPETLRALVPEKQAFDAAGSVAGTSGDAGATPIYVRPHEFEVSKSREYVSDFEGRILRTGFIGHEIRFEVEAGDGKQYELQIPFAQYDALGLRAGDTVYFRPRAYKTFWAAGI